MQATYIPATPYARLLAKERGVDLNRAAATGKLGEVRAQDVLALAPGFTSVVNANARPTPLAQRMAADLGIDLSQVAGTGHDGKIRKADILWALANPTALLEAEPVAVEGETRVKLSGMRKIVAQRMSKSHTEIPSVTHTVKVDVTALTEAREKLKASGKKYSFNDFVLLAVIKALEIHRNMLVSIEDDEVIHKTRINIGMAVGLDAGLVVPVILDADQMSIDELSAAAGDLAARARGNKLLPDEFRGNTFTVSNLGMFDVESFTPIINQPDAAILGVCSIQDELALSGGVVVARKVMRTCLTYDHRLLDGTDAAKFQKEIKRLLENPVELFM